MFDVETTNLKSVPWRSCRDRRLALGERRSRDSMPMPLLPTFADPVLFLRVPACPSAQLQTHEPDGLGAERHKQQSGKKLGPTKAFAREKSVHGTTECFTMSQPHYAQSSVTVDTGAVGCTVPTNWNLSGMTDLENTPGPDSPPESQPPAPNFAAATQPPYVRTLFFGPDGLRPGWGLGFYVLMFYFLSRLANDLVERYGPAGSLRSMMLEEFCWLLAAVIPSLVLAQIERRPWETYGLPPRQAFRKLFWVGATWGFAGITLLLVTLNRIHVFDFGHLALHGPRIVGFWWAATLLSCAFVLIHIRNGGEEWNGLLAVACIGLFFALTLRRTGTLWFAVGFHAAWDWGETFFYSVPDSGIVFPGHLLKSRLHGARWLTGGSVGPEGSFLCFVVIALFSFAFSRTYRPVKYPEKSIRS